MAEFYMESTLELLAYKNKKLELDYEKMLPKVVEITSITGKY